MTPMRALCTVILALVTLGFARVARADSDGYYCIGPRYLAYELALSHPRQAHVLYVVQLGGSHGIGQRATLELPLFQVHGMRCRSDAVELLGWDSLYTVRLGDSPQLSLAATVAPWAGRGTSRQPLADYPSANLGAWSEAARVGQPDSIPLAIQSSSHRFVLYFDVRPHPTQACRYKLSTRLVALDQSGRAVRSLTLFDGIGTMECGE